MPFYITVKRQCLILKIKKKNTITTTINPEISCVISIHKITFIASIEFIKYCIVKRLSNVYLVGFQLYNFHFCYYLLCDIILFYIHVQFILQNHFFYLVFIVVICLLMKIKFFWFPIEYYVWWTIFFYFTVNCLLLGCFALQSWNSKER